MTQSLTDDQKRGLDIMLKGDNCFLTGSPGCGKTYLLNIFIQKMKGSNILITASTGIAASHINGSTFHSVNKLGLGKEDLKILSAQMKRNRKVSKMWRECRCVIIEEISMLDPDYFDKMSSVIGEVRGDSRPFGGVQVILCGDFLQLPPIGTSKMIFETTSWQNLKLKNIILTTTVRQNDKDFIGVLSKLRFGIVDDESMLYLEQRVRRNEETLKLYPLRKDVDSENLRMLEKIESPERIYEARFTSTCSDNTINSKNYESLVKDMVARRTLTLKVGAKVLYLANNPNQGLVNGSRGEVVGFDGKYPIVKFRNSSLTVTYHSWERKTSDGIFTFSQLPLLCCYGISIHKSQGMSLDEAEIDLGKNIFECGMAYVALSRIKTIEGVYISSLDRKSFIANKKSIKFYEDLKSDI